MAARGRKPSLQRMQPTVRALAYTCRAGFQIIQIVRPCLHHLPPFGQALRAVVRGSDLVPFLMSKLELDEVRIPALFVEQGTRQGSKAVRGHCSLL